MVKQDELSEFDRLKEGAVQLAMVVFHATVLSYSTDKAGVPEYALYDDPTNVKRNAKLWFTPYCLLIEQKHARKILPNTVIKDSKIK